MGTARRSVSPARPLFDDVDPVRSDLMRRIRGKDTRPERVVRSLLHRAGYRFRLHARDLPGRPDLVLPRHKTVVFVHGCFWHRHARCPKATTPRTRREFWAAKFEANRTRDRRAIRALRRLGWHVVVVWECRTFDEDRLRRELLAQLPPLDRPAPTAPRAPNESRIPATARRATETRAPRVLHAARRSAAPSSSRDAPPAAVELFCGIGGFRIAADKAGFRTAWANDVDPRACAVYRDRFGPDVLHPGDLRTLVSEVPPHALLTAGFPCQPFSSAGKKHGVRDPRGTLFETIVALLDRHRPAAFVLENVKRLLAMEQGAHFATILAALAGLPYRIEWRLLDARDFGLPQNRQRVVVVGVRDDRVPDSGRVRWPGLLVTRGELRAVGPCDAAEGRPIAEHAARFPTWGVAAAGRFVGCAIQGFAESRPCGALRDVLETEVAAEFDFTPSTRERLKAARRVGRFVDGVEILANQDGGARMGYTVFGTRGVAPTLTATPSRHYERYRIGRRYRRLTPVEYARLQGFPDDHCTAAPSRAAQYALYGNAIAPPMATWVLRRLRAVCR